MTAHQELSGQLGRYVIVRKLGAGGMGAVYLAEDTQLGRKVALKVPHFGADAGSAVVERFRREARLAASIEHPNLCPVHDVGEVGGILFFTMPLIEGTVLSHLIEEGKPWPALKAVELVRKIAGAVAHLHQHGIIHRDLKPSNIMVRASGEPLLMDFGLARSLTSQTERLTSTGTPLGSPAYMSPEQVAGASDIGSAADVYGLGMILYELLAAHVPFEGPLAVLFAQILHTPPTAPSSFCPGLDGRLDALCLQALSKKPEDRQSSVAVLVAEMASFAPQQTYPMATPVPIPATLVGAVAMSQPIAPIPPTVAPDRDDTAGGANDRLAATEVQAAEGVERGHRSTRRNRAWILAGLVALVALVLGAWIRINGGKPKPLAAEFENSLGMKMVLIPKGRFLMGSPEGEQDSADDEHPQHEVTISRDFHMAATKVTVGQFRQFVNDDGYQTEAERDGEGGSGFDFKTGKHVSGLEYTWKNPGWEQSDEHPVVNVTWNDAVKFCAWLSRKENEVYDLPTEAEWEYACRAGSAAAYCFGNDVSKLGDYAWYVANAGKIGAQPVGKKKANAWGLHDMHGNAYEWCLDSQRTYQAGPITDPVGDVQEELRGLRGGSWSDRARYCRSAFRGGDARDLRAYDVGFRVVLRTEARTP